MRIVIITQNDPFFLGRSLDYLLKTLPHEHNVVACVLLSASPFGKKETLFQKIKKTISIFGPFFLIGYGLYFLKGKLKGYPTVKSALRQKGVPIVQLEKNINHEDSLNTINSFGPELLISIAGNQIFKTKLINLAPKGCLNLHTALLPKYRGLMPTFWVLKNNEKKTGVSVFLVDEGIDSGPIVVQKEYIIEKTDSQQKLIERTKALGMEAIVEAVDKINRGNYNLQDNPESEMTYFSFPTAQDVREFRKLGKKFF